MSFHPFKKVADFQACHEQAKNVSRAKAHGKKPNWFDNSVPEKVVWDLPEDATGGMTPPPGAKKQQQAQQAQQAQQQAKEEEEEEWEEWEDATAAEEVAPLRVGPYLPAPNLYPYGGAGAGATGHDGKDCFRQRVSVRSDTYDTLLFG